MLYALQQGPTEKMILEQCYKTNTPVPDIIVNAPELMPGLSFYYDIFLDLSANRQVGFAEHPIRLTEIWDYCKYYHIDGELLDDVVHHIQAMDIKYLLHRQEQRKNNAKR